MKCCEYGPWSENCGQDHELNYDLKKFYNIANQMAKMLIGNAEDKKLSNEISAPYEVPQYPIEQIETKLIRSVTSQIA